MLMPRQSQVIEALQFCSFFQACSMGYSMSSEMSCKLQFSSLISKKYVTLITFGIAMNL
jgi:hypothetical protein